jgi:hypothetical protein
VTVVWVTFILSEGDHRLYHVEPWVKEHQRTLSRCIGSRVKPRDFTDDRLATVLDSAHRGMLVAFEALNAPDARRPPATTRGARGQHDGGGLVTPEGSANLVTARIIVPICRR